MSLITLEFFIFLCVMLISYYLVPKSVQWIVLLSGSLIFYAYASPKYLIFILVSSSSAFICAKLIEAEHLRIKAANTDNGDSKSNSKGKSKLYMVLGVAINIGILAVLKYTGFFFEIINSVIRTNLPYLRFILPLGISFYTFMVISYVVDVYREDIEAEDNFLKFLLFVSYFPQITEGPINRYAHTAEKLYAERSFDFGRCKHAGYRILLGLFKKVVIAGRFSVYVDRVFENVKGYGGLTLFTSVIFYAIQIYADFSGCMDIVMGISALFGVDMDENFNLPFFSKSVGEFWRRWHITLGSWVKDYIYNPVFKSEFCRKLKAKIKKTPLKKKGTNITAAIALMCVWLFTGTWHGAAMHYVIYGVYYGIIIIFSLFMSNVYKKIHKTLPINWDSKGYHFFEIIRTLFIVSIGFLIFRANDMSEVFYVLKVIVTRFSISSASLAEAILPFTEDNTALSYGAVAFLATFIMFLSEIFEYNGIDVFKKHKYLCATFLIVFTLLFGVFGESGFLYAAY